MIATKKFRYKRLVLAMVMPCALLVATPAMAGASWKEVKQEVSQAVDTIQGYTAAQRGEAIQASKTTLATLDAQIANLERKYEQEQAQWTEAARTQAKTALNNLRRQRNAIAEWYGGLRHSSDAAWDNVKNGFVGAYRKLADAFDKAENQF